MTIPTGSKEETEGGPELPCGAKIAAEDRRASLERLLARVEAADGPDRQLDAEIWCAAVPGWRIWADGRAHVVAPANEPDHWGFTQEQQDAIRAAQIEHRWSEVEANTHLAEFGTAFYRDPRNALALYDGRFVSSTKNPNRRSSDPLTASAEAALALVERALPGWCVSLQRVNGWRAALADIPTASHYEGEAESLPLAIVAALVKALLDRADDPLPLPPRDELNASLKSREDPLPYREELERALREIKGLNDQFAGESPVARRIDEIASRALTSKEQNNG